MITKGKIHSVLECFTKANECSIAGILKMLEVSLMMKGLLQYIMCYLNKNESYVCSIGGGYAQPCDKSRNVLNFTGNGWL